MTRTAITNGDLRTDIADSPLRFVPSQIRDVRTSEMVSRFAFGCGAAVIAGLVAILLGNRPGGLFLAFPAILPASLTLLAKKDGRSKAEFDAVGATIGAVSLVLFAAATLLLVGRFSIVLVEGCAFVVWLFGALGLYLLFRVVSDKTR